jgi:hypothetical protein
VRIDWRTKKPRGRILRRPGSILMIIEFAPLVFGTAALLAVFLFFSIPEH